MMLREAQLVGVGLITVVLHACFLTICVAKDHKTCSPSSCGDIRNISYPFRLQGDPPSCGYPEYELICENNRTMINLNGGKYYGKYHVTQINYHNYTIRVVDPAQKKGNCWISSPLHSIGAYYEEYGFSSYDPYNERTTPYSMLYNSRFEPMFYTIVLMKCEQSIRDDKCIPIVPCNTTGYSTSSPTYAYAVVGDYVSVRDIPYSCTIGTYMVIQPLKALPEPSNLSMLDLQDYLLLGLQLSFLGDYCSRQCEMKGQFCFKEEWNAFQCEKPWGVHILNTSEKNCEYKMPSYLIFGLGVTVPAFMEIP